MIIEMVDFCALLYKYIKSLKIGEYYEKRMAKKTGK